MYPTSNHYYQEMDILLHILPLGSAVVLLRSDRQAPRGPTWFRCCGSKPHISPHLPVLPFGPAVALVLRGVRRKRCNTYPTSNRYSTEGSTYYCMFCSTDYCILCNLVLLLLLFFGGIVGSAYHTHLSPLLMLQSSSHITSPPRTTV